MSHRPEVHVVKVDAQNRITLPSSLTQQLNLDQEMACFIQNGMLICKPMYEDDFTVEILRDLLSEGYEGKQLVDQFEKTQNDLRQAVEQMIVEANEIVNQANKRKNETQE